MNEEQMMGAVVKELGLTDWRAFTLTEWSQVKGQLPISIYLIRGHGLMVAIDARWVRKAQISWDYVPEFAAKTRSWSDPDLLDLLRADLDRIEGHRLVAMHRQMRDRWVKNL